MMHKPGRQLGKDSEFEIKLLDIARVTRVVAGGRRFSFRILLAVGDKKGRIGLGMAKGADVSSGIDKATRQGKKNLISIPLVKGTIPHQVEAKYKAAKIYLWPRKKGFVIGGVLRQMARLAGIESITGKRRGSSNKIVNARAFMKAIESLEKNAVSSNKIDDKKEK